MIRARSAENLGPAAARLIHELIPDQPVERIATLKQIREETVAPQRLNALLVGAFGVVALAIAAVGIGGTLAFFIARRTAGIGIRMSLGADSRRVIGMVLGDGGRLLALGLGLGLAGSALLARAIRGMLFGVPPQDPVTSWEWRRWCWWSGSRRVRDRRCGRRGWIRWWRCGRSSWWHSRPVRRVRGSAARP